MHVCAQNDTIHAWYSHSHNACSWLGESGIAWAPGGDLTHSISTDGGQTWGNTTVRACGSTSMTMGFSTCLLQCLQLDAGKNQPESAF